MISQALKITALLAASGLVHACDLVNTLTEPMTEPETRPEYCQPQNEGRWTFAMGISEVSVPTFDGKNALAGVAGHKAFIVYDHDCIPYGIYEPGNSNGQGNDCGIPYWINDIEELPYQIQITQVMMDVGGGDFTFEYANGAYMIGENGATCETITHDLRGEEACSATFPINGEGLVAIIPSETPTPSPSKRSWSEGKRGWY